MYVLVWVEAYRVGVSGNFRFVGVNSKFQDYISKVFRLTNDDNSENCVLNNLMDSSKIASLINALCRY